MKKSLQTEPSRARYILEELEERRLFSGGIEGLIDADLDSDANAIYRDLDAATTQTNQSGEAATAAEGQSREIAFVDAGVDNYQQLVDDLLANSDTSRNIEVVVLDRDQDGIDQISAQLRDRIDLDAVHIISHGTDGSVELGNDSLTNETLQDNNLSIALWANAFAETGDILIYGCNLAGSEAGQSLIDALSGLTLTDVAASDDLTGQEALGGDWDLEYRAGGVEAEVALSEAAQASWAGALANTAPTDLAVGVEMNTDGGNDAYLATTNAGAILGGLNQLTVEIIFLSNGQEDSPSLLSYATATEDDEFAIMTDTSSGTVNLYIGGTKLDTNYSFAPLNDDQPHSLAVSWDNTNGDWTLAVDGEPVASGTGYGLGYTLDTGGTLVLGNDQDAIGGGFSTGQELTGSLFDVRVWNEVRSAEEIALNHQHKFDPGSLPSGLIANWQMDGFNGSNEVVDEVSGNNLSIGHASGTGFTTSTPIVDLNVDENSANGTSVGFVVPSDSDVHNDLVGDGRFLEAGTPATWIGYNADGSGNGADFGDWTATEYVAFVYNSSDGTFIDDTPLGGNIVRLAAGTNAAISQSLTTEPGKTYQVVFAASGSWDTSGVKELRVSAAGQSNDYTFDEKPAGWDYFSNILWEHHSLTFTATDTITDLSFGDITATMDQGTLIADVQVIELPASSNAILTADPSLDYDAGTGKFYRLVSTPEVFDSALINATASTLNGVSGQLVKIQSAYENGLVQSYAAQAGDDIWLGATDRTTEGEFYWLDGASDGDHLWTGGDGGSAVSGAYTNFQGTGPDDFGGAEDQVALLRTGGEWDDQGISTTNAYVIEWDASEVLSNYSFSLTDDAGGRFAIDNSGQITVANSSLIDYETATSHDITVRATDAGGLTYDEVLTISVTDIYEPVSAVTDNVSTNVDTALIINPTANDSGTVNVIDFTQPVNGNLVDNGDGTFTYTPDASYIGADSFDYVITDYTANLSHYWNLDGSAVDSMGSSNGTVNGRPTTVSGQFGDALSFDEFDDHVVIPDTSYNNEFSISFDFKIDDISGSSYQYLYSHGTISTQNSININLGETGSAYAGILLTNFADSNDTVDSSALNVDINSFVADGQWHRYTFTTSAAEGSKVYLDGVLSNSDARGGDAFDPTTDLYLGARDDLEAPRFFGGSIDSVQIYDSALSSAYVADMSGGSHQATVNITVDPNNPAVIGGVDTGSVQEDIGVVANNISTGGLLTITDPDVGESSFQAATISGTYGDLTIDTVGNWSYSVDNTLAVIQQLDVLENITDTLTVTSFDGSTHNVVITINGTEDASVISGTSTGSVTEDGSLTSSGLLVITDTDSSDPTDFADLTSQAGDNGHGTFEITANTWTYVLDNNDPAVQALDAGETLTDTYTFSAPDGVTQLVTVTINGAEDTPVFDSTAVTAATEDVAYSYTITTSDVDVESVTITAPTRPAWLSFVDNGDGAASLSGTPTNAEVGNHNVVLNVSDGTLNSNQNFTIVVANANDPAVIGGVDTGSVQEDIGVVANNISTGGLLTITDPDVGESSFQAATISGTYGDLTIDTVGNWSYSVDNDNPEIQALQAGESMTDTLTVTTADGTSHQVVVVVNGANEAVPPPEAPLSTVEPPPDVEVPPPEGGITAKKAVGGGEEILAEIVPIPQESVMPVMQEAEEVDYLQQDEQGETDKQVRLQGNEVARVEQQPQSPALKPHALDTDKLSLQVSDDEALNEQFELELLDRIDRMHQGMDGDATRQNANDVEVQIIMGSSVSLTAGFVSWVLRGGSLLASFMSTVPLLNRFDPLPILKTREDRENGAADIDTDDDTRTSGHARKVNDMFTGDDEARP